MSGRLTFDLVPANGPMTPDQRAISEFCQAVVRHARGLDNPVLALDGLMSGIIAVAADRGLDPDFVAEALREMADNFAAHVRNVRFANARAANRPERPS